MPGRSKPPAFDDGRYSHGTEPLLDAARGRQRGRYASGGNRLVRKQRLPANASHVARIAAAERRDLLAELEQRKGEGKLTVSDYTLVDCVYWATAALLEAYRFCEHAGLVNEAEKSFHPIVEQAARLQRMKQSALEKLGVDRQPEPRDVWVEARRLADQQQPPAGSNARLAASEPQAAAADSEPASGPQRSTGDSGASAARSGESGEMPGAAPFDAVDRDAAHDPAAHDTAADLADK
jgi:hypothetical protein